MLYNIDDIENVFDLIVYTIKSMKEVGYNETDIDDYIEESVKNNNYYIVELSKERLNDCNILARDANKCSNDDWFEDTWRDHYYASMWDDDGRYNDEDLYDCVTRKDKRNIWDDDNVIDDIETEDEKEAYEGFSSCKNHYWDSSEEDDEEEFSNHINDYYDNMNREFDPSCDLCYDPWTDDNGK
jgi:hypothetical protein